MHVFEKFVEGDDTFDQKCFRLFAEDQTSFKAAATLCQSLLPLYSLCSSPEADTTLKFLGLSTPVVNTRPLLSFSSPRLASHPYYWKVPEHQDWPSTQGSLDSATMWVPLVDVTTEMGALDVAPGSHLLGLLEHVDETVPVMKKTWEGEWLSVPMNAGDALFMSSFLVHRSGHNATDKVRLSAHFRYDNADEPTFVARKYPRIRADQRLKTEPPAGFPTQEQVRSTFKTSL